MSHDITGFFELAAIALITAAMMAIAALPFIARLL